MAGLNTNEKERTHYSGQLSLVVSSLNVPEPYVGHNDIVLGEQEKRVSDMQSSRDD